MLRMAWRDHRGKPVRLYRSGVLPLPFVGEHPVASPVWKRMRAKAMTRWSKEWRDPPPGTKKPMYWRGIVWGVLPTLWFFSWMFVARLMFAPGSWLTLAILPLWCAPMFGLIWWNWTRSLNQWPPEEIETGMLGESLCPQCGYPLRGVREEDDGCRVCPECGAAWRCNA